MLVLGLVSLVAQTQPLSSNACLPRGEGLGLGGQTKDWLVSLH